MSPSAPPSTTPRQPVRPSSGGLLSRHFTYRPAAQTDVRLTWARARSSSTAGSQHQHTEST